MKETGTYDLVFRKLEEDDKFVVYIDYIETINNENRIGYSPKKTEYIGIRTPLLKTQTEHTHSLRQYLHTKEYMLYKIWNLMIIMMLL